MKNFIRELNDQDLGWIECSDGLDEELGCLFFGVIMCNRCWSLFFKFVYLKINFVEMNNM